MLYEAKDITVKELKFLLNDLKEESLVKVYCSYDSKFKSNFFIDSFECTNDGKDKTLIYI